VASARLTSGLVSQRDLRAGCPLTPTPARFHANDTHSSVSAPCDADTSTGRPPASHHHRLSARHTVSRFSRAVGRYPRVAIGGGSRRAIAGCRDARLRCRRPVSAPMPASGPGCRDAQLVARPHHTKRGVVRAGPRRACLHHTSAPGSGAWTVADPGQHGRPTPGPSVAWCGDFMRAGVSVRGHPARKSRGRPATTSAGRWPRDSAWPVPEKGLLIRPFRHGSCGRPRSGICRSAGRTSSRAAGRSARCRRRCRSGSGRP
jgi:hypothetical protein